jgi:hypothetical protein
VMPGQPGGHGQSPGNLDPGISVTLTAEQLSLDGTRLDGMRDRGYLLTANSKHQLTRTTLCRQCEVR